MPIKPFLRALFDAGRGQRQARGGKIGRALRKRNGEAGLVNIDLIRQLLDTRNLPHYFFHSHDA